MLVEIAADSPRTENCATEACAPLRIERNAARLA
jgi:hypothetical protein